MIPFCFKMEAYKLVPMGFTTAYDVHDKRSENIRLTSFFKEESKQARLRSFSVSLGPARPSYAISWQSHARFVE